MWWRKTSIIKVWNTLKDMVMLIQTWNITAYVLGSKVDLFEKKNPIMKENIEINPREYDLIIKTAKNRTFNLINRIKKMLKV